VGGSYDKRIPIALVHFTFPDLTQDKASAHDLVCTTRHPNSVCALTVDRVHSESRHTCHSHRSIQRLNTIGVGAATRTSHDGTGDGRGHTGDDCWAVDFETQGF
jgi:hypothetical protein